MRVVLQSRVASTLAKLAVTPSYKLLQSSLPFKTQKFSHGIAAGLARKPISVLANLAQTDNPSKRLKTSMGAVDGPLAGLEPANVWGFFNELTKIPRPSKHEEKCALPAIIICSVSLIDAQFQ